MPHAQKAPAPWPMMAPMMAWSPQVWLAAMFGGLSQADGKSEPRAARPAAAEVAIKAALPDTGAWIKAGSQTAAELMALAGRRSQAVVALSADVAKCRAPHELMGLQLQFWQTAMQQHTEAAQRIAANWFGVLPSATASAGGSPAAAASAPPTPRDRITFTEPRDVAPPSSTTPRANGDRRSAA